MLFRNRRDAGQALARALMHLAGRDVVVLALPRGGVPVAFAVAKALSAPLDLLMVRKIGVPDFPELAAGAVVDGAPPEMVVNEAIVREMAIAPDYLEAAARRELAEIGRRRGLYLPGRPPEPLEGRTVILVDDGIATGATARVALQALARAGAAWRVLAAPVAPPELPAALRPLCDEVVILATPSPFGAVGAFYEDFTQTGDAEVIALLQQARAPATGGDTPGR